MENNEVNSDELMEWIYKVYPEFQRSKVTKEQPKIKTKRHNKLKLDVEQINYIRNNYKDKHIKEWCTEFNISKATVRGILNRKGAYEFV